MKNIKQESFINAVKLVGIINYNSLEYGNYDNNHTFLTIKTENKENKDVFIKCTAFNQILSEFKKGDKVQIFGEISSYFNKQKNMHIQNVSILTIEKV